MLIDFINWKLIIFHHLENMSLSKEKVVSGPKIHIVYGLGYSDEGKGIAVARIYKSFDTQKKIYVLRCNAGTNASHTIETQDIKMVTMHLPSVILSKDSDTTFVITPGMVFNPFVFFDELNKRPDKDNLKGKVKIASTVPIVLPFYIVSNKNEKTGQKFGTTNQGTGVANRARLNRHCIRPYDIINCTPEELLNKIKFSCETLNIEVKDTDIEECIVKLKDTFGQLHEILGDFSTDYSSFVRRINSEDCDVIVEGCNGALICNVFGQVPYVTSCMTGINAMLAYTNLDPTKIMKIHCVTGAYICCLNKRILPTEIKDQTIIQELRQKCNEIDSAEDMERRLGWFDLPALRKALPFVNGKMVLHLNKFDAIMSVKREFIPVCTHYKINGQFYEIMPDDEHLLKDAIPVYKDIPFDNYIQFIEEQLGIHIEYIGVGPKIDNFEIIPFK